MLIPPNAKYTVGGLYTKETPEGAEIETSELLAALIRHQKPFRCLETGTAHGQTAEAIGRALRQNGRGILHTCDIERKPILADRLRDLPVVFHEKRGIDLINEMTFEWDFVFIDSWWCPVRIEEVEAVVPKINPGGYLCLHDSSQNYRSVYDAALAASGWPSMVFHAPYGLAVLRRPSDDDWSGVGKPVELEPITPPIS